MLSHSVTLILELYKKFKKNQEKITGLLRPSRMPVYSIANMLQKICSPIYSQLYELYNLVWTRDSWHILLIGVVEISFLSPQVTLN